jgi:hypothetical protein
MTCECRSVPIRYADVRETAHVQTRKRLKFTQTCHFKSGLRIWADTPLEAFNIPD